MKTLSLGGRKIHYVKAKGKRWIVCNGKSSEVSRREYKESFRFFVSQGYAII